MVMLAKYTGDQNIEFFEVAMAIIGLAEVLQNQHQDGQGNTDLIHTHL